MESETLVELADRAGGCVACRLSTGRTTVVFGTGSPTANLMFVGEGPGREEDLAGVPFVGRSGRLLDQLIASELGLSRAECYIANVVKCRPPNNRDPEPDEVAACRPYLEGQIAAIGPQVIMTLGNFATRAILSTTEGITKLRGRAYPLGAVAVVPTFHPAAALRGGGEVLAKMRADFVRARLTLDGSLPVGERP
jgi:DNA polymerase